jgi:hypothetical protein
MTLHGDYVQGMFSKTQLVACWCLFRTCTTVTLWGGREPRFGPNSAEMLASRSFPTRRPTPLTPRARRESFNQTVGRGMNHPLPPSRTWTMVPDPNRYQANRAAPDVHMVQPCPPNVLSRSPRMCTSFRLMDAPAYQPSPSPVALRWWVQEHCAIFY